MEYNKQVRFVFDEYFASTGRYYKAKYGEDNKLPLSEIKIECNVPQCGGPEGMYFADQSAAMYLAFPLH